MYIHLLYRLVTIVRLEEEIQMKDFSSPTHKVGLEIMFTGYWLSDNVSSLLKPYGISVEQYNVLRILKGQKGKPINLFSIQERMIHKMSNTTRLVEKLRLKALIERVTCANNRRMVEITITDEGLELLKYLDPIMKANMQSTFALLTTKEAKQLSSLLQKVRG